MSARSNAISGPILSAVLAVGTLGAGVPACSGTLGGPTTFGSGSSGAGRGRGAGEGGDSAIPPSSDRPPSGDDGSQPGTGPGRGDLPAFPGAEGFGARATGGRGGRVIAVTTLRARGPRSMQQAVAAPGPRIVVFAVSGVIAGDIVIPHGDITIAGQSAPGAGITLAGRLSTRYRYGVDNIIVRHIRVRPVYDGSEGEQFDAIQFSRSKRIMIDHVSVGFGVDETVDLYEARDVTVQWSIIESSATRGHPEGKHNYGLINGPDGARISVHHNLFAHHKNRCPAIANGPAEVINNVAYNVRHAFVHHNPASGPFNIVGNYYKAGGDDQLIPFWFDDEAGFQARDLAYYLRDNYIDDPGSSCPGMVQNPWKECRQDLFAREKQRAETEFDFRGVSRYWAPVKIDSPTDAYDRVLRRAGTFPRDVVSRRSVRETRKRTGRWGSRIPERLMDGLAAGQAPADGDGDGMADDWERENGLDPGSRADQQRVMPSGYPAIEDYLNHLADRLTPR